MNNFTKNTIVQKIIIVLVFLTIFNFIYPYIPSFAVDSIEKQNEEVGAGGILLAPVISLVIAIGDGGISLCQRMLIGQKESFIQIDNHEGLFSAVIGNFAGGLAAVRNSSCYRSYYCYYWGDGITYFNISRSWKPR